MLSARCVQARDNVALFLSWVRKLGVDEAVMFETNDLIEGHNLKNVLYCLMEVGARPAWVHAG